jgi:hypothetical protein
MEASSVRDLAHEPCASRHRNTGYQAWVTLGTLGSLASGQQEAFKKQWRRDRCDNVDHDSAVRLLLHDASVSGGSHSPSEIRVSLTNPLGGGLNNMLMNVAEFVAHTCPGGQPLATLVLPRLQRGDSFFRGEARKERKGAAREASLRFDEVFDVPQLQRALAPCLVDSERWGEGPGPAVAPPMSTWPRLAYRVWQLPRPITMTFRYIAEAETIYGGLRLAPRVEAQLALTRSQLDATLGSRWAAIHLRVERDWWVDSGFCNRARHPVQRCVLPDAVAKLTAPTRAVAGATGVLLLYAVDMIPKGMVVDPLTFSPQGRTATGFPLVDTVLRRLNYSEPRREYTLRAALDMALAVSAPAGFFGNGFSSFSRGVAQVRIPMRAIGKVSEAREFAAQERLFARQLLCEHGRMSHSKV